MSTALVATCSCYGEGAPRFIFEKLPQNPTDIHVAFARLTIQDTTLNCPLYSLPAEILAKILSFCTKAKDFRAFVSMSKRVYNLFPQMVRNIDAFTMSKMISLLLNVSCEQHWTAFFARLGNTVYSKPTLCVTIQTARSDQDLRINRLKAHFHNICDITIDSEKTSFAGLFVLLPGLKKLHLKEFAPISNEELESVSFPAGLEDVTVNLYSKKRAKESVVLTAKALHQLFISAPALKRLTITDCRDSPLDHVPLDAILWPLTLEELHLPKWILSDKEVIHLFSRTKTLRQLDVKSLQVSFRPCTLASLQLPQSLERLYFSDSRQRQMLEKQLLAHEQEITVSQNGLLVQLLANAYSNSGFVNDLKRAKELVELALTLMPNNIDLLFSLATLLLDGKVPKDPPRARKLLEKQLLIKPDHAPALERLANLLYTGDTGVAQDKEVAHHIVLTLSTQGPRTFSFLIPVINALIRTTQNATVAFEILQMVTTRSTQPAQFYLTLGDMFYYGNSREKDLALAKSFLEKAIATCGKQADRQFIINAALRTLDSINREQS